MNTSDYVTYLGVDLQSKSPAHFMQYKLSYVA